MHANLWSPTLSHEHSPKFHATFLVEVQKSCCRSAFSRYAHNMSVVLELKIVVAVLFPGIK